MPEAKALEQPIQQPVQPWLVFSCALTKNEFAAYTEMFRKITTALGLGEDEFKLDLKDSIHQITSASQVRVSFGGETLGWSEASGAGFKTLTVSSLEDMVKNPELKKLVWSYLKQAMDFRRA